MSNHINIKAQNALNKIQSILFSYLEADPKKVQNISTIIPSNRNNANGYANLKVTYIDYANIIQTKTIRLETNIFGDCIFLKPKKAVSLKNVDLIIFYDEKLDSFYLSDKTICNMKWLDDKSIRDIVTDPYGKTFYSYKIDTLLEHHNILQLIKYDKVHIIHDSFLHYYQGIVLKGHTDTKKYVDYTPKKAKDFYILCDAKDRDTIFWCYHNELQANKAATLLGLADEFSKYSNLTQKAIYDRLYRALKKETYAKITLRNNLSDLERNKIIKFIKDGKIVIGLSKIQDTFINKKINKTDDKAAYMRQYRQK